MLGLSNILCSGIFSVMKRFTHAGIATFGYEIQFPGLFHY